MRYIYIVICLLICSCDLSNFAGIVEEGVSVDISNQTNTVYSSASMYVGAIKNNQFIVMDSIKSKGPIEIKNDINEWKIGFDHFNPNLEKVFNISNEGALYCEIKGGLSLFFEPFNKNKYGRYNRFGGFSSTIILKNDDTFIYTQNNLDKQDFEVVK